MKQKYFDICRKLASHSDHPQHKHGCVIVRGNKVVSLGYNKNSTHTRSLHPHKRLHAEVSAIVKAGEDLSNCSIYIYRETKSKTPAMSRPCESCFQLIVESGIKTVYYSVTNGYKEEYV